MDGTDLAAVVQIGDQLFAYKLLLTSIQCLWIYDYFLTLGDEIKYAWSGRRSWLFALFIANRYTPVLYLVWVHTTLFHYKKPDTKWDPILHTVAVTVLAQITVGLRVYAVTGKNKLIGGALALTIAVQLCHGIFSIIWLALGPLEPFPEINLDPFKLCVYKRWRLGELMYYNLAIFFDLLAFSIILVTARRSTGSRYPGIPSILDTIVQDSTQYFILIFFVQLLAQLFIFFAPFGIQLLPGGANTILTPVMASRLMLSLKKASLQPLKPWSPEIMTTTGHRRPTGDGTINLALRMPRGLHETSRAPVSSNEEDMELGAAPRSPRTRDSHHGR